MTEFPFSNELFLYLKHMETKAGKFMFFGAEIKNRGIDNLLRSRICNTLMYWVSHQIYEAPGVRHPKLSPHLEIKTQWEEETKIRLGAPNSSDIIMKQTPYHIRKQRKLDTQLLMTRQWCYDKYYSLKSTWNQINTHSWLLCLWNNYLFPGNITMAVTPHWLWQ